MTTPPANSKPRVLVLFSDTGGGHRSAAEAVVEALKARYGEAFTLTLVDIFKEYAPRPLNRVPDWYPYMVKAPRLWSAGYKMTDGRPQARAITATGWPVAARTARRIIADHPSDLILTVHPFANSWILKALGDKRPPFVTLVTDWISNHALWYDKRADQIFVPTEEARKGAIGYGMDGDKVRVVGFPLASRHCIPPGDKPALRKALGWPADKMIVLLLGGRDGMGPIVKTCQAVNDAKLDIFLAVIAGKNDQLKKEVEAVKWKIPGQVYGFTTEMPALLRAADCVISKAGAATVAEALNAGTPMLFHSRIPGQEEGNVDYAVKAGAGVWAPTPAKVVDTLKVWLENPNALKRTARACHQAATPNSAALIAQLLGNLLKIEQV
jgi:1,2-diacylglycerol 3-beta-galactosyltransferase